MYLLRHSDRECTAEEISTGTNISIQEVSDAMIFWQQVNIFTPQNAPQSVPTVFPTVALRQNENETAISEKNSPEQRTKPCFQPTDIKEMIKDSPDLRELFDVAESILGMINNIWQNSLIWLYKYLGLKNEVIVTLIGYCKEIDKASPRYVEAVAKRWADDDINTLELAQEEVQHLTELKDYTKQIMKHFQIERLAKSQREMIEEWKKKGISFSTVCDAYEETLKQINKLSFPYLNKILISWSENGRSDEHKWKNPKNKTLDDEDFDVNMYSIFVNDFEVI